MTMRQTIAIVLTMGLIAAPAMAETMAPVSVVGKATFQQDGKNWNITTAADKTVINWSSFGVAQGAQVHFQQPNSGSSVLNRALGSQASHINGLLSSNGSVYLFNPNGIVIGPGGVIRVADFVASTLRLTDADFLAGRDMNFKGTSSASIENYGKIDAIGGDIYLIATNVVNRGTLTASSGSVNLAAGADVLLTQDHKLFIRPSSPADGTGVGVDNSGVIDAVVARLQAHGNMYALAINNTGVVRATGCLVADGRVLMRAEGGSVVNAGSVIARTVQADGKTVGGEVQVLGDTVAITGNATIDASGDAGGGRILIGGDLRGANPAVYNAQTTFIGSDAVVSADALVAGDGGTVIVWADGDTTARGTISAQGAAGGDGGFVETSGHTLDLDGLDLSIGQGGSWLLDAPPVINTVRAGIIVTALELGPVSVTYESATNISVEAPIVATATPSNRFLRLKAATDIAIGENINIGAGKLYLQAGSGVSQATGTTLVAASLQLRGNGNFDLSQPDNDFGTIAFMVRGGGMVSIQDINDIVIGNVGRTHGISAVDGTDGGQVQIRTPNGNILANGLFPEGVVKGYYALGNVAIAESSLNSQTYEIWILNELPSKSPGQIEDFLGLDPGSLDPLAAPDINATGSAVRIEFVDLAGDSLGYGWNFKTMQTYEPGAANDYSFVVINRLGQWGGPPAPAVPEQIADVEMATTSAKQESGGFSWQTGWAEEDRELDHLSTYELCLGAMNVRDDEQVSRLDVRDIRFTGHPLPPIRFFVYDRIFDYVEDFPHIRPDIRVSGVGGQLLAPSLDELSTYFDESSQRTDPRYFYQSVGSIYQIPR